MGTWIDRLSASRTTQALELAARFADERHRVLADNAANIDTPDYHSRRLDPQAFQTSLRRALEEPAPGGRLSLRGNAQFSTGPDQQLRVRPAVEPAPNVLFHDGTNARLEQLLGEVTENALSYEFATNMLRGKFQLLLRAIRGRVE